MRVKIPETMAKIMSQNLTQWAHWSAYHKYKVSWKNALLSVMGHAKSPAPPKVLLHITSYRSRFLDMGNLIGGSKPIPDVLKHLGWIQDDNPDHIEIIYKQEKAPKGSRGTVISLEPWRQPSDEPQAETL